MHIPMCVYIHVYKYHIVTNYNHVMSNIKWHATSGFERAHSIGGLVGKRLESSPNCSEAL